ncbi:MAG: hypothetical protein Q4G71_11070 [Pseudomonadota bacterium]|nr:hypothetical protein [Pseudomonadota bacterium]
MTHDFASLNDRRWRAMTHDKGAVRVAALRHLSCARQSAVIRHALQVTRMAGSALDN